MSTATLRAPSTRRVLERASAALAARRRAEVEVLESALTWAHAHVVTTRDEAAGWRSDSIATPGTWAAALFGEKAVPIAGTGAPLVAEFCVYELAAALDLSHEATLALLGDVLDLAHRLPKVWALVRTGRVPVHLGREAARTSRDLSVDAAAHADRLLAWQPRRLNPHRVGVLVHEARLYAVAPADLADGDIIAAYVEECRAATAAIAGLPIDAPPAWIADDMPPYSTLRELLLHVIVETSTHAGHLDICRELVDGGQRLVLDEPD